MTPTERGFRRIFWGLLFVVLDVRLGGFDVLPDFLGFGLITMGLGLLVPLHEKFRQARILAALLIVLSLVDLVEVTGLHEPTKGLDGWTAFTVFLDVLDLAMIWLLCGGIMDLARDCDRPELADAASTRRGLYVGLGVIGWVILYALRDAPEPPVALFVGLLVLAVVVMLLLMGLMLRASRELGPVDDYGEDDYGGEPC